MSNKTTILNLALVEGFNAKARPGQKVTLTLIDGQLYQTHVIDKAVIRGGKAVAFINGHPEGYDLERVRKVDGV